LKFVTVKVSAFAGVGAVREAMTQRARINFLA
jgi:hypothetical protein